MSSSLATQPFPQPSSGTAELASSGAATFDGYRLIQRINKGKLAHVYKALSPSGEIVALKIFHGLGPVAQYSYVAEANAAINLKHDNILETRHVGYFAGKPYVETPFCADGTLYDLLGRRSCLFTRDEALHVLLQLASALAYIHRKRVVDCDLKLTNIVVHSERRLHIKVADLGYAISLDGETALVGGTCGYAPKEQLECGKPDLAWDIHAFGVVMYQVITFQCVFGMARDLRLVEALAGSLVRQLNEEMLHDDPRKRPTADDVLSILTTIDEMNRGESSPTN